MVKRNHNPTNFFPSQPNIQPADADIRDRGRTDTDPHSTRKTSFNPAGCEPAMRGKGQPPGARDSLGARLLPDDL
jgi:hypothetical protein